MARIITDFIENNYKKHPDKVLFVDDKAYTVSEFRIFARKIGAKILEYGFFKKPVAVLMDKSVHELSAFMGVAYSGNFYCPIDSKMPLHRIDSIFEVLQPSLLIVDKKNQKKLEGANIECLTICFEDIVESALSDEKIDSNCDRIIDTDALYILFTSGSTGIPKGVVVSHRSAISYADWVAETFDINEDSVLGNQTPFYFSMSVLDIYTTLRTGATMHLIPTSLFSFPVRLLEFIRDNLIDTIYWVPSALCLVANLKALGTRDISCIKRVLFAGEVMPAKQLNMWINELPDALFANLFGPTEFTDISNYFVVDRQLSDAESVPIGKPCKNSDVFIISDDGKEIKEINVSGELYLRGSLLAYGYYNNPEKTAEAFVQNPLNSAYPEIVYKTGDLVHLNEHNELIYDGRKDFQIKHMGHRIELGEIETAASSMDGIDRCCCLYNIDNKEIVLCYSGSIDKTLLSSQLRSLVPIYMMPSVILKLQRIPTNSNGKLDRKVILERYKNGELT